MKEDVPFPRAATSEVPQTGWTKATETYSLTVLEARHPRAKMAAPRGPWRLWGRIGLSLPLAALGNLCRVTA